MIAAESGDLTDRQDIAEHVRNMRADGKVGAGKLFPKGRDQFFAVEEFRGSYVDHRAAGVQRSNDRIVLIAGNNDASPRARKRSDRKVLKLLSPIRLFILSDSRYI